MEGNIVKTIRKLSKPLQLSFRSNPSGKSLSNHKIQMVSSIVFFCLWPRRVCGKITKMFLGSRSLSTEKSLLNPPSYTFTLLSPLGWFQRRTSHISIKDVNILLCTLIIILCFPIIDFLNLAYIVVHYFVIKTTK